MAIIASGQKTIVDLSDGKSLSVYLGSNLPKTQILDVNTGSFNPDWTVTNLKITPVVYANQTAILLSDSKLTIEWKRKDGIITEEDLATGESVSGNIVTVSDNVLSETTSGLLTYIAYVTYIDDDTKLAITATADITFSLIETGANAKSVWISGDQVFKYAKGSTTANPTQITLTANLQNVSMGQWWYQDSSGTWQSYPSINNTSQTLTVSSTEQNIWIDDRASIKVTTNDSNVYDITSIYKVSDGTDGDKGTAASVVFLSNENITFAGNKDGQVGATTATCNVVAYTGTTKVTPTVGTLSGAVTGMTVTKGTTASNEVPVVITITSGAKLGGSGEQQGVISVPITSPVSTTLKINWSKVNTGLTGAAGKDAVRFSLYAPEGAVFTNGEGTLTIQTIAYIGSVAITSGATYKWEKYASGSWTTESGTGSSLSVAGSSVAGSASYRCTMTYGGNTYVDVITLTDKTDNYQATIDSTGGDIFKNTVGESDLTCRLWQGGYEVDKEGTMYIYTWYRLDKDGNPADTNSSGEAVAFATGKFVHVGSDDVDVKTTFTCEVSKAE